MITTSASSVLGVITFSFPTHSCVKYGRNTDRSKRTCDRLPEAEGKAAHHRAGVQAGGADRVLAAKGGLLGMMGRPQGNGTNNRAPVQGNHTEGLLILLCVLRHASQWVRSQGHGTNNRVPVKGNHAEGSRLLSRLWRHTSERELAGDTRRGAGAVVSRVSL